jgi:two-component system cell cycle sensor histidine kinase/response regulator CckA
MERTGFEQWKPREVARLLALVETERRYYQEMMAALPAALVVLAHDRTILSANTAFRRLVGLSGEELRKKSIEQVLPSNELIERIRALHAHGDTGAFVVNVPFSAAMGERRFRMAAVPIRSWEDEIEPETLLMVQPMEAQPAQMVEPVEAAPEPAAPAETPIELASNLVLDLATLPAAVWQADASTFAFTYAGGAAQEILGFPAAHWLAEPLFFFERIHPEDRGEVMALYQSVAAAGGEASAEYRAVHASGDAVWCRETIRVPGPTEGAGEGPRRIAGVLSVIAERRQLEAQALAAARVDALRGLSTRLAHDLNNPLMIVTGYGEELLNTLPEDDSLRSDLAEILAASGRLTELAGRLLSFTRPLANAPSRIGLTGLIAGLEPKLREICGSSGAAVELEIASPDRAVWAFADPDQLGEAIAALAAFAIENTGAVSRLAVIVRTWRVAEKVETATLKPGVYARLDIRAEGEGIGSPAGVFESILPERDPHRLAGPAVARGYLNVRQWNGDIAFSSSAAHGSAFVVYLPYAEPEQEAPAPEAPEIAAPAPAPEAPPQPVVEPSLGTVLVVEDEPGIRGLVRKILKRERYEVLEAGSGEEALAAASAHGAGIGLLLTDVILPGIGGRELAEALTASQTDLKVVYISGFTDDEAVRAGQFPPGSMFLQKPFTLSALVGAVKQAFGKPALEP